MLLPCNPCTATSQYGQRHIDILKLLVESHERAELAALDVHGPQIVGDSIVVSVLCIIRMVICRSVITFLTLDVVVVLSAMPSSCNSGISGGSGSLQGLETFSGFSVLGAG